MTTSSAPSPVATGGAGVFFEQHVAAYWLAQLLVRGIPPILIETQINEANFQTKHLGWNTDDFLVVCEGCDGTQHRLAGHVKRSFRISATDDDCKSVIGDFWTDFKTPDRFSRSTDRLLLVTQRGTTTLLKDFGGLLECARAARTAADFEHRLATKGLLSAKSVHYSCEVCKVIGAIENRVIAASDIWEFLRVIHVLTLDLFTSTRQAEAQIINLLAHTAVDGDPASVARESWKTLLDFASGAMPQARSLGRADLPADLRRRHELIGSNEHDVLNHLRAHTEPVLRRIRSTIGPELHLHRHSLVQRILEQIEEVQVVLITGPAGCGKSAIAKDVLSILSPNHFVFAFRVEEFAQPHIDNTLRTAQIPANAQILQSILAAQERKLVLIEGVERLLEKTTRDAFSDLMDLVRSDPSMRVVLTCRDYSLAQVRVSFLQPASVQDSVVAVPLLGDDELGEVEAALPDLAFPLSSRALRTILRNPYYLDKALTISWSSASALPEDERSFRSLVWQQIVRAEAFSSSGMPRRRGETLQAVAVRRARSLSDYALCNDLDPTVLDALRHDSLLIVSEDNPSLVAPAHDVIEDWAILNWLEEEHLAASGDFAALSATVGEHPAIRRSFRKWVAELIDRDPDSSERLFLSVLSEKEVCSQFRDDTLISLLRARAAPEFLRRHESALLADDNALFRRVIHLLRVACVTTPKWLSRPRPYGSVTDFPSGQIWAVILCLVDQHIETLGATERPLLLGFIEHATRDPGMWTSDINGGTCIASIAHWLLCNFDQYESAMLRQRVLKVIARIPKADPDGFASLLRGTRHDVPRRDRVAEDLRTLLFSGMDGMLAAQSHPDLMIEVATSHLLVDRKTAFRGSHARSEEIELWFGITPRLHHDFFPPSAHKGPWLALLKTHSSRTLDFFIHVFNYSIQWYVRYRSLKRLKPASEIELTFADGETRTQWCNARLWNLYRGTSVGPYVLQSLLMALEKWLLDLASEHPEQIDSVLLDLLRRSESAAIAAVVSSVATAYPNVSGETLLVLLSAPEYLFLDRQRLAAEHHASTLSDIGAHGSIESRISAEERRQANRASHRQRDLQTAVVSLQLGTFAPRVRAALDAHLAALRPTSEQTASDRLWRLAIHRMDLRQYEVTERAGAAPPTGDAGTGTDHEVAVWLEPKTPPPDLQVSVDQVSAQLVDKTAGLGVLMWGLDVFERRSGTYDPSRWREQLELARSMDGTVEHWDGSQYGPASVAAVCSRDHWDEMTHDERAWCLDVVCEAVAWDSSAGTRGESVGANPLSAVRFCAAVLPPLLCRGLSGHQVERVRVAFAASITHPVEDVRSYAVGSIDEDFWAADAQVAMRCVNAFATEAEFLRKARATEESVPYQERTALGVVAADAAGIVRDRFWQDGGIDEDAQSTMSLSEQFGAAALVRMLAILGQVPKSPVARSLFVRASKTLVAWWDLDDDRRLRRNRNFRTEASVSDHIQQFVMRTKKTEALQVLGPVLDAVDRHPQEIHHMIQGLTVIEDRDPCTSQYWYLWELFADRIRRASWITGLEGRSPIGREMLGAIFLTSGWKDDVRHWKSLTGYAERIHRLFEHLPSAPIVFDNYVLFLYHVGGQSLPQSFVRMAEALGRGDQQAMLGGGDTVFLLEVLLQRHVYGRPVELKRDKRIREGVLFLLDGLVEAGSSSAFRMRDDFLTPGPSDDDP